MTLATEDQALAIYAILMEECGARGNWRDTFVSHMTATRFPKEFRLIGARLGFGGKVYQTHTREIPYVGCYPDEETAEQREKIKRTNARIKAIFEPATAE